MQHRDSDIEQMLQDIDATEDAPDDAEQLPGTVITPAALVEPVTPFGAPNISSVVPGQSDADLAIYLATWMRAKNRELRAASLVYAGQLGSTAPKQEDYSDIGAHQVAYSDWLDRCTDRQRHLLEIARERKAEMRRTEQRAEYAQKVRDERGGDVREYVTGLSPEDHAERKRAKNAERQQRYRDRQKMNTGMSASGA